VNRYSLKHLSSAQLDRGLDRLLLAQRTYNAKVLAYVAEVAARGDFRRAGYPTMYAYLMGRWNLSESAAYKRARSARAARQFPVLFEAVADGRLHMSAIAELADHLTKDNVSQLMKLVTHKTRRQVQQLVAERFPRPDLPTRIRPLPASGVATGVQDTAIEPEAPKQCSSQAETQVVANTEAQLFPGTAGTSMAVTGTPTSPHGFQLMATAPQSFALQLTISTAARDYLKRAQELLGFQVAPNDVAGVLELALKDFVEKLEKRRCARTDRPRKTASPASKNPRHIPAAVKRQVRERDGDQCTFVSEDGVRCSERKGLEFDHILAPFDGGKATVANLRMRCRPHNQYAAECALGAEFMRRKRENAVEARRKLRAAKNGGAVPSNTELNTLPG